MKLIKRLASAACALGLFTAPVMANQTTTIPVTLTVVHSIHSIDVTMPVALPVSVLDGNVLTADTVCIINNSSEDSVEVSSVRVESADYTVVDYESFPEGTEGVIAMRINGCVTKGPGELELGESAFPVIQAGGNLPLNYTAKVSDGQEVTGVEAANVVFTLRAVGG